MIRALTRVRPDALPVPEYPRGGCEGRRLSARWAALRALLVDAYLSLTVRPLRTSATIAGIVLGVASSMTAVLVADTQQVQIDRRFDAQRSHFVVLQAGAATREEFPAAQVAQVASLPSVSHAGELSIWRESIPVALSVHGASIGAPVVAATAGGLAAAGVQGGWGVPSAGVDALGLRPVVWLGPRLADRLGIRLDLPETVSVAGRPYTVAGILGSSAAFGYLDSSVVMGSRLARDQFGPGRTMRFLAQVRPGAAAAVAEYARVSLDQSGQFALGDVTPPDGRILLGNVARDLRRIGLALGLFIGFVGMIAVANTLGMAVNQRIRELGLRAAMGWSQRRIAGLILVESGLAGLLAAVIGCGLGLLTATVWCWLQGWELIVSPALAPIVLLAGTASSVLGGLIPARMAASVSPLEAMRT